MFGRLINLFRGVQRENQFIVSYKDKHWKTDWANLLSDRTVRINYDLVNKFITLNIEQLSTGRVQALIRHLFKEDATIDEIRLRSSRTNRFETIFTNCELISHTCSYDLFSSRPVVHCLVLKAAQIDMIDNHIEIHMGKYNA